MKHFNPLFKKSLTTETVSLILLTKALLLLVTGTVIYDRFFLAPFSYVPVKQKCRHANMQKSYCTGLFYPASKLGFVREGFWVIQLLWKLAM